MGEALGQAARGLTAEAAGHDDEAASYMERALSLDVALPHLLQVLAHYFSRTGKDLLAHYAFLMRDLQTPAAMQAFAAGRPADEKARYTPWAVRRSMSEATPDLYGLGELKAALAERHGPEGAAMVLASVDAPGPKRRAASVPLRPLIDHAREHAADYTEPIPARDVSARWPRVFAGEPQPAYSARSRTLFTATLEDVVVTGKSNVLLAPDHALHDVQGDELTRIPVDLRVDPLVSEFDGRTAIVSAPTTALPYGASRKRSGSAASTQMRSGTGSSSSCPRCGRSLPNGSTRPCSSHCRPPDAASALGGAALLRGNGATHRASTWSAAAGGSPDSCLAIGLHAGRSAAGRDRPTG